MMRHLVLILFCVLHLSADQYFEFAGSYEGIQWVEHEILTTNNDTKMFVVDYDKKHKKQHIIQVLDISDPKHPTLFNEIVCSSESKYRIKRFQISNDEKYLFVSVYGVPPKRHRTDRDKLLIFNIEDLHNIKLIKQIDEIRDFILSPQNDYIYISYFKCLKVFDMAEIKNLKYISSYAETAITLEAISPDGNFLIARSYEYNLYITLLDLRDKTNLLLLDGTSERYQHRMSWKTSSDIRNVVFDQTSRYVYVASGRNGVITYDLKNENLQDSSQTAGVHWGGLFNTTGFITSVSIYENILYVGGSHHDKKNSGEVKKFKGNIKGYITHGLNVHVSKKGKYLFNMGSYGWPKRINIFKIIDRRNRNEN